MRKGAATGNWRKTAKGIRHNSVISKVNNIYSESSFGVGLFLLLRSPPAEEHPFPYPWWVGLSRNSSSTMGCGGSKGPPSSTETDNALGDNKVEPNVTSLGPPLAIEAHDSEIEWHTKDELMVADSVAGNKMLGITVSETCWSVCITFIWQILWWNVISRSLWVYSLVEMRGRSAVWTGFVRMGAFQWEVPIKGRSQGSLYGTWMK